MAPDSALCQPHRDAGGGQCAQRPFAGGLRRSTAGIGDQRQLIAGVIEVGVRQAIHARTVEPIALQHDAGTIEAQAVEGPALQNDFASLTLNYEYVWYGEFEVEKDIYDKIEKGFRNFNQKV